MYELKLDRAELSAVINALAKWNTESGNAALRSIAHQEPTTAGAIISAQQRVL